MKTSFRPTAKIEHFSKSGFDETGQPKFVRNGFVKVAILRYEDRHTETSIRADRSATSARSEERETKGRLMIYPTHSHVETGDVVKIQGELVELVSVRPRFDMSGYIHHYQADIVAFGREESEIVA
jgi:hypothetical protein